MVQRVCRASCHAPPIASPASSDGQMPGTDWLVTHGQDVSTHTKVLFHHRIAGGQKQSCASCLSLQGSYSVGTSRLCQLQPHKPFSQWLLLQKWGWGGVSTPTWTWSSPMAISHPPNPAAILVHPTSQKSDLDENLLLTSGFQRTDGWSCPKHISPVLSVQTDNVLAFTDDHIYGKGPIVALHFVHPLGFQWLGPHQQFVLH